MSQITVSDASARLNALIDAQPEAHMIKLALIVAFVIVAYAAQAAT